MSARSVPDTLTPMGLLIPVASISIRLRIGGIQTVDKPGTGYTLQATSTGQVQSPSNAFPAVATSTQAGLQVYGPTGTAPTTLDPAIIQNTGGSQPHDNFQPYLCVNFIMSMYGIFPSQS